jgi:hypothetical protein
MPESENYPELTAIRRMLDALDGLEPAAQTTAIDFVARKLGLTPQQPQMLPAVERSTIPTVDVGDAKQHGIMDIRTLKDQKNPHFDHEKAALVAYYLRYHAPEAEQKDSVGAEDIRKYFHQAGFRMPASPGQTLTNAKNAGYFDQAERGQYRLNPVGYNLIAHRLPAAQKPLPRAGSKQRKKTRKRR